MTEPKKVTDTQTCPICGIKIPMDIYDSENITVMKYRVPKEEQRTCYHCRLKYIERHNNGK